MVHCPYCSRENDSAAAYCQSCGRSLTSLPSTGTPAANVTVQYGGFWKRVAAWVIDTVVVHTVTGIILAGTMGIGFVAIFLLPWVYEAWLESTEWQATLGKKALGLIVTDLKGRRITFARATGRHFAKWISALALGIGYIMAAFTQKKQGLHDIIAETIVVTGSR